MLVADPTVTAKNASAIATIIARRLDVDYFDVLTRLRKPDTHFQYLARRVPSTQARAVVDTIEARGNKGIDTRRDPVRTYPAEDVAANLVGFMNAEGDAGEGAELMFDTTALGQGRLGHLRGRRRQPDPARRQQRVVSRAAARTCASPSTGTCSGTPSGCSATRWRTPAAPRARRS